MRIAATLLLVTGTLIAAESGTRQDIFKLEGSQYKLFRIPCLAVSAKGTVLAYCEARHGNGDWAAIDLLLRRSTDGGKTWDEPRMIGHVPKDAVKNPAATVIKSVKATDITQNNPMMIPEPDGTIHLVYCIEYARAFHRVSSDDGVTWSEPVEITGAFEPLKKQYDWKVLATGPGHGIRLKNGRLLIPVWLSTGTGGNAHRPSVVTTLVSDDRGKTWKAGDIAVPDTAECVNPNETVAVELADGRVLMNVRHEGPSHRRVQVTSPDGTSNWSAPAFIDELVEPICFGSLVRYDESTLLFCHPINMLKNGKPGEPGKGRDRKTLALHRSDDEGKTWPRHIILSEGPSGYSDMAVLKDGTLLVLYERGNFDPKSTTRPVAMTLITLSAADLPK